MTHLFEVDLGHLHLVDGVQQAAPLPGVLLAEAPRRCARGRDRDQLLLSLYLIARGGDHSDDYEKLLRLATQHYYGTPGTVTAATRAAFGAVSRELMRVHRHNPAGGPIKAGLTCAVWRGAELYLSQAGPGTAFVIQGAGAEQFPQPGRELRPLGATNTPEVQYFHTTLAEGDFLLLCQTSPTGWRTGALRTVNTGSLEPALSRLVHLAGNNTLAVVARFAPAGESPDLPAALANFERRRAAQAPPAAQPHPPGAPAPAADESSLANILARVRAATELGDEAVPSPETIQEMSVTAAAHEDVAQESIPTHEPIRAPAEAPLDWDWPEEFRPEPALEADEPASGPDLPPPEEWVDLAADSATREARPESDATLSTGNAMTPEPAEWIDLSAAEAEGAEPASAQAAALPTWSPQEPSTWTTASGGAGAAARRARASITEPGRAGTEAAPVEQEQAEEYTDEEYEAEEVTEDAPPRARGLALPTLDLGGALKSALRRLRTWYVGLPLERLRPRVEAGTSSIGRSLAGSSRNLVRRLVPVRATPAGKPYIVPDRVLIAIAVLVPIVVVLLASGLYVTEGQSKQYEAVMAQARIEAGQARIAPDPLSARPHWDAVLGWLDQADKTLPNQGESAQMRQEAQGVIDSLDGIVRVPVAGVTAAGFSANARITKAVAVGNDLFALDSNAQTVYRAIRTVSGSYDVDRTFLCRPGLGGEHEVANLVDIAWLTGPNPVGQDALLGFDSSGVIMYCLTDGSSPATTALTAPPNGWSSPRAIGLFADRLYVLDPGSNQVWVYDRVGGVYSQPPSPYFSDTVFDLSNAIDFAIAQGDLFILRRDGSITQCTRTTFETPECAERAIFADARLGRSTGDHLSDVSTPISLVYDPPPEPSLYLADADNLGAYQLSLWLVFQRQYRPATDFDQPISAVVVGAGKEIYYASGNNVYVGLRP